MTDWLFSWFTPKGWLDALCKLAGVLGMIVMSNVVFAEIYLGYQPVGLDYYAFNAAFVGTPWLVFFFVISLKQDKTKKELEHLSRTDFLTQLRNRRHFLQGARQVLAAGDAPVLLMLDADHFKEINDRHGHAAGDECLRAIGSQLQKVLGPDDIAGRLGGEEFGVALFDASDARLDDIVTVLVGPMDIHLPEEGTDLSVTISIGGVRSMHGDRLEVLMARADAALYRAKVSGRAQFVLWDETEPAFKTGKTVAA